MPPDPQQRLPTDPSPMFQTDEQLLRRLGMVENAVAHLESQLPGLRREVDALRKILEPCGA